MVSYNWKRTRDVGSIKIVEKKFYIFCEGTKTEPNYFNGIKKRIEKKAIYKNSVFVNVQGVGRGTGKILDFAEKYVNRNEITDAEVWIVYDKDDFLDKDFNEVVLRTNVLNSGGGTVEYNVAWSNQCIEYWFVLHFDYYVSNNDRAYYMMYLSKKFKALGVGGYKKNDKDIFEKLENYGDSNNAIKYAEKRLLSFSGISDAKMVPATKVHLLYQKLKEYF